MYSTLLHVVCFHINNILLLDPRWSEHSSKLYCLYQVTWVPPDMLSRVCTFKFEKHEINTDAEWALTSCFTNCLPVLPPCIPISHPKQPFSPLLKLSPSLLSLQSWFCFPNSSKCYVETLHCKKYWRKMTQLQNSSRNHLRSLQFHGTPFIYPHCVGFCSVSFPSSMTIDSWRDAACFT